MLENCEVNNYRIVEQLGSGGYGFVFHVKHNLSNKDFAMKIIIKSLPHSTHTNNKTQYRLIKDEIIHFFRMNQYHLSIPPVDLNSIKNTPSSSSSSNNAHYYKEIALHSNVHSHKNIVTIHDVLECSIGVFLFMDYYPNDLFHSIVQDKLFVHNGWLIKRVALQLASAIDYCHAKGIYHCDIKPENILLDNHNNAYLCDFGLATTDPHLTPNVSIGSSFYMAPERVLCLNQDDNTNNLNTTLFSTDKADIWSLGVLLINLTCIRNPWQKANQLEDTTFKYYSKDSSVLFKILPISHEFYHILISILQVDPSQRCDISSLMVMIKDCTSFHRVDTHYNTVNDPLLSVPVLTDKEFNEFIAINEFDDDILDMNYLYDSFRSTDINKLTNIDDESTLYTNTTTTTDNLNKVASNNNSRFDISTTNTVVSSSNNLAQYYSNATPR